MELELSGSVCGSNSDASCSENEDKELEEELYSVLHYSDFSNGIPEELKEKYDIFIKDSECYIQLKTDKADETNSNEKSTSSSSECVEIDEDSTLSSSSDSSTNDIVILEPDPFIVSTPSVSGKVYETLSSDMSNTGSLSDSDSSDLILLEDTNRRSPILLSDDDDDDDDLQINLDRSEKEDGSISDGQVSDVVGESSYDWKDVSSPSTWSTAMKKYYNRPCSTLRYFDFRRIKNDLMNAKGAKWPINNGDKFNVNIPRRRCHICRQPGHIAQTCPKRYPVCLMCGTEGHSRKQCPDSKCLNCGRHAGSYITMCGKCEKTSGASKCFTCNQRGHWSKECPNHWRQYHSTTGSESKPPQSDSSVNPNVNCSNCGEQGHFYERCRQGYFSPYPPVSSLIIENDARNQPLEAEPNRSRKRKNKDDNAPNSSRQTPDGKRFKRRKDFFRHLSFSEERQGGKNGSKKRKQKRYFNLTA